MMIHSGVHLHLGQSPAVRKMQSLSKEMEKKCGQVLSHCKGGREAPQISSVAGTKPCHTFKDAMP